MNAPLRHTPSTEGTALETQRPCEPFNFRQDVGEGFLVGSVAGSAYLLARGGIHAVWTLTPYAGMCGAIVWGSSSAVQHARRKEDTPTLNHALATGAAWGITSLPKGIRAAGRSTLIGGAVGAVLFGGCKLLLGDPPRNLSPQQEAGR